MYKTLVPLFVYMTFMSYEYLRLSILSMNAINGPPVAPGMKYTVWFRSLNDALSPLSTL